MEKARLADSVNAAKSHTRGETMRYFSVLCTTLLFLITSCGGGGSSGGGGGGGEVSFDTSQYYYQPGEGDVIIYKVTIAPEQPYYEKSVFTLEDSDIPDEYNYEARKGLEGNPHILEKVTVGLDLINYTDTTGLIYYSLDGQEIIDDQLYPGEPPVWLFTNIGYYSIDNEEPESLVVGREYESTIEEILFDHSNPPNDVGNRKITTIITPLGIESVLVHGKTYEALIIAIESDSEETIEGGSTVTLTGSGTMWFGRNTGLVKVQMEYTRQKDEEDPETFDYLLELVEINLSGESVSPASMQIAPPAKTVPIQALMKNISHIVHPRLP